MAEEERCSPIVELPAHGGGNATTALPTSTASQLMFAVHDVVTDGAEQADRERQRERDAVPGRVPTRGRPWSLTAQLCRRGRRATTTPATGR